MLVTSTYCLRRVSFFFFFNDTATTEIYTLSLHDALPISLGADEDVHVRADLALLGQDAISDARVRSEEHTSELQSRLHLVCRLLLEKKKKKTLLSTLQPYACATAAL